MSNHADRRRTAELPPFAPGVEFGILDLDFDGRCAVDHTTPTPAADAWLAEVLDVNGAVA